MIVYNEDILRNVTITSISAGKLHSMVLTDTGEGISFGDNYYGQLGDLSILSKPQPVKIEKINVTQLSSGNYFSSVILNDKRVVSWGSNFFGKLGIKFERIDYNYKYDLFEYVLKEQIENIKIIEKVSSGYGFSNFIFNNELYFFFF